MGKGWMAPAIQEIVRKPFPMAAQPGRSAFPDTTAVPMADGGTDDRTEKVCQTGGTTGIYGMIFNYRTFVQNREILMLLSRTCGCPLIHCKSSPCHGFKTLYAAAGRISLWEVAHGEKAAVSGTDAPVSLVIMTDALPL